MTRTLALLVPVCCASIRCEHNQISPQCLSPIGQMLVYVLVIASFGISSVRQCPSFHGSLLATAFPSASKASHGSWLGRTPSDGSL